jgi:hypothetical protein
MYSGLQHELDLATLRVKLWLYVVLIVFELPEICGTWN